MSGEGETKTWTFLVWREDVHLRVAPWMIELEVDDTAEAARMFVRVGKELEGWRDAIVSVCVHAEDKPGHAFKYSVCDGVAVPLPKMSRLYGAN